jgi:RimJ/RimL family protein N-acetyltransferase
MSCNPQIGPANLLELQRFKPRHAVTVASWVGDEAELFRLAPTTEPPLTAEKVIGWTSPVGRPYILVRVGQHVPYGYAELNPWRGSELHLWIGHVIVDPALRGKGIGGELTRLLVEKAFATGARRISLIVFPDNQPAIRSYVRAGFELCGDEYHRFGRRRHRMLRFERQCPRAETWSPTVQAQISLSEPRISPNLPNSPATLRYGRS